MSDARPCSCRWESGRSEGWPPEDRGRLSGRLGREVVESEYRRTDKGEDEETISSAWHPARRSHRNELGIGPQIWRLDVENQVEYVNVPVTDTMFSRKMKDSRVFRVGILHMTRTFDRPV